MSMITSMLAGAYFMLSLISFMIQFIFPFKLDFMLVGFIALGCGLFLVCYNKELDKKNEKN